jgi:hypothetical protein
MAVRLSIILSGRPLPPRKIHGTHFCYRLSRPQGSIALGKIRSNKKSSKVIWIRTHDLLACSIVSQSTALLRSPHLQECQWKLKQTATGDVQFSVNRHRNIGTKNMCNCICKEFHGNTLLFLTRNDVPRIESYFSWPGFGISWLILCTFLQCLQTNTEITPPN